MSSEIGGSSRETLGPLTELRVEVFQGCCTCWICKGNLGWGGQRVGGGGGIEASRLITNLILRNGAFCRSRAAPCLSPSSASPLPLPRPPRRPRVSARHLRDITGIERGRRPLQVDGGGLHAIAAESANARTCAPERSEVKGASARLQQRVSLNSSVGSTAT